MFKLKNNLFSYPLFQALIISISFYLGAKLGLALSTSPDHIATFWPPNTIILTALLLTTPRRWWFFFLAMAPAYFLAAFQGGYSIPRSLIFFGANCSEILIAAGALRFFFKERVDFEQMSGMVHFLLWAVIIAPLISAFIASLATLNEPLVHYWLAYRVWFMGDALGNLTLTPVCLLWIYFIRGGLKQLKPPAIIEALSLSLGLFFTGLFAFGQDFLAEGMIPLKVYLPLPFLLWATVRFGPRGICTAILAFSVLSIMSTLSGENAFDSVTVADEVLFLQLFLFAISIPLMLLATVLSERKRKEIDLQESEEKYRELFENANDAIYLIDPQTMKILDCNSKASELDGFSKEELKESHVHDLHPEEELKILPETFKDIREKGHLSGIRGFHHQRKDGILVPIEVNASIIKIGEQSFNLSIVRDVSHIKQFEQKINKDRERLLSLLNAIPGFVYLQSQDYSIAFANDTFKKLFGEPGTKPCYNAIRGRTEPCEDCPTFKLFEDPEPQVWEWQKSENEYFQIYDYPFIDSDGIVRVLEMGMDISKRKVMEEQLRESEENFRSLSENAPNIIFRIDKTGHILYMNHTPAGIPLEEVKGKSMYFYIHPDFHDLVKEKVNTVFTKGVMGKYEMKGVGPHGKESAYASNVSPVFGKKGVVISAVIVTQDITEKEEKDRVLRRSEEKHRAILELTSEGFWALDVGGNIIEVNQALCEMLDYRADEIIGKLPIDFVDENSAHIFRHQLSKISQDPHRDYQISLQKQDGSLFPTLISATTTRDKKGEVSGGFAFITVISDIKKVENELREAKVEAEEATKIKDKFVSLVAHDLRGPVGTILNLLKMVGKKDLPQEDKNKTVDLAIQSAENMQTLFTELLSMNRIQSGKIRPKLRFTDIELLTQLAMDEFQPRAEKKGITLINTVPEQTLIFTDEVLLRQVIQNFISNAVKFCSEGNTVKLEYLKEESIRIAVSDDGPGINPEQFENIFSYDVITSTKGSRGEKGIGFGLPICHDIMKALGGMIHVKNANGTGAVFTAEFPSIRPTILLADDEKIFRLEQKQQLKWAISDVEFLEAENGKEALELLEKRHPHLIIADINMPIIDGYELLSRLKEDRKTQDIPLILVTGSPDVLARTKAFKEGASDFIEKPLNPDAFIPRVKRFFC